MQKTKKHYDLNKGCFVILICCLMALVSSAFGEKVVNSTLNYADNRPAVTLNRQTTEHKVLFFYKPGCPDCKKVLVPAYILQRLTHRLVFVDVSNPYNQTYIYQYGLHQVPTFIKNHHRYAGTNWGRIIQFVF